MKEELSDKEKRFVANIENVANKRILNYITVGISLCLAMIGITLGIIFKSKDGFLMALFFGAMGINILIITELYIKFSAIVRKLMQDNGIGSQQSTK